MKNRSTHLLSLGIGLSCSLLMLSSTCAAENIKQPTGSEPLTSQEPSASTEPSDNQEASASKKTSTSPDSPPRPENQETTAGTGQEAGNPSSDEASNDSPAIDFSGNIALEARYFPHDGIHPNQSNGGLSISLQPEFRKRWDNDRKSFTFIPFYRWDNKDNERSHADIRQLDGVVASGDWEFQLGIGKVFWGVTESQHLVDIINQTDSVENIDGEDKLGQPMIRASRIMDEGSLSLYLLPYFRERTFPGTAGRLRSPMVIDTNHPLYESSDKEHHLDYAVRWNHTFSDIDLGLSWFKGTSRDADFQLSPETSTLVPYYRQIKQLGLDLQYTSEAWLWKLEALRRENKDTGYNAAVGGFEYTFAGVNDAGADLGVIAEYHTDSRGEKATSLFQNDLFLGARFALNDSQSTEILAGGVFDLDNQSQSFRIEASRRIGNNIKVNLEAQAISPSDDDITYPLRTDDFIQFEIQRFF